MNMPMAFPGIVARDLRAGAPRQPDLNRNPTGSAEAAASRQLAGPGRD